MLEWATSQVISLIGPLANLTNAQREIRQKALREFWDALVQTQFYTSELDSGKVRNRDTERDLAHRWGSVAISFSDIDREFAKVLRDKSTYWINPDEWHGSPASELNISLEMLHANYAAIFSKEKPTSGPR